jgi:ATP-binding cassette subfamily F protein uup
VRALVPEGDQVVYGDRTLHVASWAKRFLFRTEQLETSVSKLSGGEKARIVLARLMLQPADLLVLDEPTNDLDISTLEVLEDSLLDFPGALVLVTHDRYLIDRVSTSILALDGKGSAEYFADYGQWESNRPRVSAPLRETPSPNRAPSASPTKTNANGTAWRPQSTPPSPASPPRPPPPTTPQSRRMPPSSSNAPPNSPPRKRRSIGIYARWAELERKFTDRLYTRTT